jgi:hypothetical protein
MSGSQLEKLKSNCKEMLLSANRFIAFSPKKNEIVIRMRIRIAITIFFENFGKLLGKDIFGNFKSLNFEKRPPLLF